MKKSGIYKIINITTNDFYIGSSVNLDRRRYEHYSQLKKGKHGNLHLQNSFNKYGENTFQFVILEYCDKENCILIEQKYINNLKPTFNINPNSGSSLGVKHREETIDKIRKSKLGGKHTEETKNKIKEGLQKLKDNGWVGSHRKRTEEEKEKMRNHPSVIKKLKPILQFTLDGELLKEWSGSNEIMRELGYHAIHISRCCNNKRKTAYGFYWKFK